MSRNLEAVRGENCLPITRNRLFTNSSCFSRSSPCAGRPLDWCGTWHYVFAALQHSHHVFSTPSQPPFKAVCHSEVPVPWQPSPTPVVSVSVDSLTLGISYHRGPRAEAIVFPGILSQVLTWTRVSFFLLASVTSSHFFF